MPKGYSTNKEVKNNPLEKAGINKILEENITQIFS